MRQRGVSHDQIILLARWLAAEPEFPAGRWFKKFPGMTVCGEGELIKNFCNRASFLTAKKFEANNF